MVPGDGAAIGALTSLTRPLTDWEESPLQVILEAFRERLGSIAPAQVTGLALATIDVAAVVALGYPTHSPAPADAVLGAHGVATTLPSGRTLLLLEPATEGRLAAFLARHGEGLAALYLRPAGSARPASTTARGPVGRARGTALGRPGRLLAGERVGDAVIVLV